MRKTKTRKRKLQQIQHHHLLIRLETKKCPDKKNLSDIKHTIIQIINDINMVLLSPPEAYYVDSPKENEGLTAVATIKTSHISLHFWKNPEKRILKNKNSNCLLQFDLYTCGTLTHYQISRVLHHLTKYEPTHVNSTLLNRKYSLTIDNHMTWDVNKNKVTWANWIDSMLKV